MALFVVNEWFWEDLRGENGRIKQGQTFELLNRFSRSDHQMIMIRHSKFDNKAWALCKSPDSTVRSIGKLFVLTIRYDSNRCRTLDENEVAELPEDLNRSVDGEDHYLVRAQLTVGNAILVTTDKKLQKILLEHDLGCINRENFLKDYFAIDPKT